MEKQNPVVKSLYKFKELKGEHPFFDSVFILVARAGLPTYIDRILEEMPNCAAGFEYVGDDTVRLTKYFFSDNPNGGEDEAVGAETLYQGPDKIFLSQKDENGSTGSICTFRRGRYFEVCEIDSDVLITPENVNMDYLDKQISELASTYSPVETCKYAISRVWDLQKRVESPE
jgi:hypothetical protein